MARIPSVLFPREDSGGCNAEKQSNACNTAADGFFALLGKLFFADFTGRLGKACGTESCVTVLGNYLMPLCIGVDIETADVSESSRFSLKISGNVNDCVAA